MAVRIMPNSGLRPIVVSPQRALANAQVVSEVAGTYDAVSLRRSFLAALEQLQPICVDLHRSADESFLIFEPGSAREEKAFATIMVVDSFSKASLYNATEREAIRAVMRDAFAVIAGVDQDLYAAINTIIGAFIFAKLPHYDGGSISSVIGCIWLAMPPERGILAFAETIVHEFVHQCLFLEDMTRGIFIGGEGVLAEQESLVTSAIRKVKRGYDKSFHSAVVALVLAWFWTRLGNEEKVRSYLAPLGTTLLELQERMRCLTPHGQLVLADILDGSLGPSLVSP